MDLKRNITSPIQPPSQIKSSPLMNPLINISNASTPVRTRVIKPGSQLNSTPVNVHKIGVPFNIKSPSLTNKQNNQGNCSKLAFKKARIQQHSHTGTSPIMALNRKQQNTNNNHNNNINVNIKQLRSLTPNTNTFKRQQSLGNIMQHHNNTNTLHEMRNSNTFKGMLESRSKTPTRTAFASTLQRQDSLSTMMMRASGSAHSLLQGGGGLQGVTNKLRDSRNIKLIQSRSFQPVNGVNISGLASPTPKDNQVLCSNSNEHQKKVKAKYKVVQEPEDEQLLVYCSKCAINLVQKGFKVEELSQQDIFKIKTNQQNQHYDQPNVNINNQYEEYAEQTQRKLKIKLNQLSFQKQQLNSFFQKDIQQIQCYYDSIINLVEEQKRKDKEKRQKNMQKQRKVGEILQRKLSEAVGRLGYMMRRGISGQQLGQIQQIQCLLAEQGYKNGINQGTQCRQNLQSKFDDFSQYFQTEGKLKVDKNQGEDKQQHFYQQQYQSSSQYQYQHPQHQQQYYSQKQSRGDNPLRFSFEKHHQQQMQNCNQNNKRSPFVFRNQTINTLEEAPESLEGEDSTEMAHVQQKQAFRTLFPQDEHEGEEQIGTKGIHSPTFKQI